MGKLFMLSVEEDDLEIIEKVMALIASTEPAICTGVSSAPLRYKALCIDTAYRQVFWQGKFIGLTPMEFGVFHSLVRRSGRIFSQRETYEFAVSDSFDNSWTGISSIIYKLCHKLNADFTQTVHGKGYKFSPP